MIAGTKAEPVIAIIEQIPLKKTKNMISIDMVAAKMFLILVSQIGSIQKLP
jgi:hypothetical protein